MSHASVLRPHQQPSVDPFVFSRYIFHPSPLSLGYTYYIDNESGAGRLVVRKHPFSLASHVDVFAAAEPGRRILAIQQDSPFQFMESTYTVFDVQNQPIANVRYNGWLWMHGWGMYLGTNQLGMFRVLDPGLTEICQGNADLSLLGMNFDITRPDGAMLGRFTRRLALTDNHTLDLSVDILGTLDRRIAIALGILMDFTRRR